MNIYPIIQFDIYIYIYIYIYMYDICFFIYCDIVATHTHTGHTDFTFR